MQNDKSKVIALLSEISRCFPEARLVKFNAPREKPRKTLDSAHELKSLQEFLSENKKSGEQLSLDFGDEGNGEQGGPNDYQAPLKREKYISFRS